MTTRIDGRPDDDLLNQKGFRGFPSVAIMDAEGEIVKKGVGRSVAAMGSAIDAVSAYNTIKTKVASGEKGLDAALFVASVRLGKIDADEAKEKLGKYKLSAADKKIVEGLIFDKEMDGWFSKARSRGLTPQEFFAKIYDAYKAGRRPSDSEESQNTFWNFLLQGAEEAGDVEAFQAAVEKAIARTKKGFADRLEAIKNKAKRAKK